MTSRVENMTPTQTSVASLAKEEETLVKQIDERKKRIAALSKEAETLRNDAAEAFRTKYAERFADLDVLKALAGQPTNHVLKVFGGHYYLAPPARRITHQVEKFCLNAGDAGPVQPEEALLLAWLTAVGGEGLQPKPLYLMPVNERLELIRSLPENLLTKFADECQYIQSYLNVCLEKELGNS